MCSGLVLAALIAELRVELGSKTCISLWSGGWRGSSVNVGNEGVTVSHQQIGDSSLGLGFVLLSCYLLHRCLCERDSKPLG